MHDTKESVDVVNIEDMVTTCTTCCKQKRTILTQ